MEGFSKTLGDISDKTEAQRLIRLSQTETKRGSDVFDDSFKYISRVNEEFKLSRPKRDLSADSIQVNSLPYQCVQNLSVIHYLSFQISTNILLKEVKANVQKLLLGIDCKGRQSDALIL